MSEALKSVESALDEIKSKSTSRQRYYFGIIGFVLGAVITALYFIF